MPFNFPASIISLFAKRSFRVMSLSAFTCVIQGTPVGFVLKMEKLT